MRQNINAYTITYTPKNAFRHRRVTEAFTSFSEARTRAMQILIEKCPRYWKFKEEQFIKDGVLHYRLFLFGSEHGGCHRFSVTIKSLTAVETNALRNDFDNVAKREKEKSAETPTPAPTNSVGGEMIRKMIEEYERNNR